MMTSAVDCGASIISQLTRHCNRKMPIFAKKLQKWVDKRIEMWYDLHDPILGQFKKHLEGRMLMLDVNKLNGKIAEAGLNKSKLAAAIGIAPNTLSRKLNGKRDLTVGEIDRICTALKITDGATKASIFLA